MASRSPSQRNAHWFRSTVVYEVVPRSFRDANGDGVGDLAGVTEKLDYLADLGIGAIWLLPFYRSPWRDEGYDIADHYTVDPSLGTVADLDRLVHEAHARSIRVLGDLVTNHVSLEHPWFQEARRDRASPYRSWFLWSDTAKEFSRSRVIFRDFERANWTWDDVAGQYYFHRFYAFQPDLNYDSPEVHAEMLRVARFWLGHGLDGYRCDAVPYLYKREGTRCQSLPEVHRFFRELRAMMDAEFPGSVLVAEANQSVPETVPYFGDGHEFQMVMHFPLMPNLFLAWGEGDPRRVRHVLRATLPTPNGSAWAYFLRNHDEVTLEQTSDDEREMFLWLYGRDDRTVINGGIRRRLAPMLDGDDASVLFLTALVLSLPGTPFLYYGDEIGMGDRPDIADRDGVRTPMQWTSGPSGGFSTSTPDRLVRPPVIDPKYAPDARNVADQASRPGSLLSEVRRLIAWRKAHPAEAVGDDFSRSNGEGPGVLAFSRNGGSTRTLHIYNFSRDAASGSLRLPRALEPVVLEPGPGEASWTLADGRLSYRIQGRSFAWFAASTGPK